jgi:hypothetical protein
MDSLLKWSAIDTSVDPDLKLWYRSWASLDWQNRTENENIDAKIELSSRDEVVARILDRKCDGRKREKDVIFAKYKSMLNSI